MSQVASHSHSHRRLRALLAIPVVAIALIAPAKPAHASCIANAPGIANSGGVAAIASTDACPPAYGQPAGTGVGRKVG
jgi:hypothetical protein